ncbi:MAG: LOG family protein [Deltaproteobacteria bacterium]|jgi:predicted Rossmann-fold nucleotide-binding protein|nr:LOG family protein [Deltaproteobacteria bacterium]
MGQIYTNNHLFRGLLQSEDGVITKVYDANARSIAFEATFGLGQELIEQLKNQPEHIVFSERSRIARLGIQIKCDPPGADGLEGDKITLSLVASAVISGYPGLNEIKDFFSLGLPIGRLVFCDPDALLSSDEVLAAIERADLKLPESTTISSDGSIVIAPHKVVCQFRAPLDKRTLGRILLREDGRELLNRYQVRRAVPSVNVAAGEGVVTTCSMYLNEHFVVLQSGFAMGRNLPATVLDPIKTRGIRIYLEIVNQSDHPIVNPLISARVYTATRSPIGVRKKKSASTDTHFTYGQMRDFEKRLTPADNSTCHFIAKPVAVIQGKANELKKARIFLNGPGQSCEVTKAMCALARRNFSPESECAHLYATSRIQNVIEKSPAMLAMKYFPNIIEHRDIINLTCEGKLKALYFYEPSCEHGPFLSQQDHHRLEEYHAFGLEVYWVSDLNGHLMKHTMRDGMGYFVAPGRLADFHKSMLLEFYGSNQRLSAAGEARLGTLMDALIDFRGQRIGIVTGGGSGVMEQANTLARKRGILSGANFLDITDQSMTTDVDFCQIFQATCRHSRQKWFEIASFPIFNVGGLGSLEELGITLCNMKLSILDPVPVILFDTEGDGDFWSGIDGQIKEMIKRGRAPGWIKDNIVITDDPKVVTDVYRQRLQLF